jgi:membrane protease YdiL (CAAX protease family)
MKSENAPFLPHERISARTAACSLAVGLGLVAPLVIFLACLPFPHSPDAEVGRQQRNVEYAAHAGALFFKAVLFFPLVEEIFYRGIILQILRRYFSGWFAISFSAAFFGVTHLGQGVSTALNAFLLGCFFAWLVMRSRSLYPSILCHAAFNFSWLFVLVPAFGLNEKALRHPAGSLSPLEIFPIWWVVASVGVVCGGLVVLTKELSKKESHRPHQATVDVPGSDA